MKRSSLLPLLALVLTLVASRAWAHGYGGHRGYGSFHSYRSYAPAVFFDVLPLYVQPPPLVVQGQYVAPLQQPVQAIYGGLGLADYYVQPFYVRERAPRHDHVPRHRR